MAEICVNAIIAQHRFRSRDQAAGSANFLRHERLGLILRFQKRNTLSAITPHFQAHSVGFGGR
ncbi:MAG: hypothetical protein V1899_09205 [Planctomycetota bacterium]